MKQKANLEHHYIFRKKNVLAFGVLICIKGTLGIHLLIMHLGYTIALSSIPRSLDTGNAFSCTSFEDKQNQTLWFRRTLCFIFKSILSSQYSHFEPNTRLLLLYSALLRTVVFSDTCLGTALPRTKAIHGDKV
uniref:Uncharacterized protein n=1 Tax=Coturnix japonica TaxID=93934 RepID=A0A8C2SYE8_COTJA